jgi:hypothetical protein
VFYDDDYLPEDIYQREEARMGARWLIQDGKGCSCHNTGWILTMGDTWVKCPCVFSGLGPHPEDDTVSDEEWEVWMFWKHYLLN